MQRVLQTLLPSLHISPGLNMLSFPPEIMTCFEMEVVCLCPSCVTSVALVLPRASTCRGWAVSVTAASSIPLVPSSLFLLYFDFDPLQFAFNEVFIVECPWVRFQTAEIKPHSG